MNDSIFLRTVLEQMELKDADGFAAPFDIEVREFSAQNKTGGRYRVYNDARLLISKPKAGSGKKDLLQKLNSVSKERRDPNHYENLTRNLELASGDKKKINIRFIIKFNGKKVNY